MLQHASLCREGGPMRRASTYVSASLAASCLALGASRAPAQDLDPRAYVWVPVNATILVAGLAVSHGPVVADAAPPIQELRASVHTPSRGLALAAPVFGA